jgi:FKBP-type peptidyl-prolyl cis-trans isomerase
MKSKLFISVSLLAGLTLVLGSCLDTDNVSPYQQMQEDIAKIDAYLANNPPVDPTDIVVRDAYSGIRMVITEVPPSIQDSIPPTQKNILVVDYVGKLFSNGAQFDAGNNFVFTITTDDAGGTDVIEGWKFALSLMTPGMKATVYIPSGMAYGPSGKGSIPKNAILVFDLYLKVVDTSDEEPRLTNDKGLINAALEGVEDVVTLPSGVAYTTQQIGSGATPTLYDQVRIRYTGKLLNGTVFAQSIEQGPVNIFSSMVANYPHGLAIGLQRMQQGGKATFYVPSALGYGSTSSGVITPNSNLIFEVELLEVFPNGQ